MKYGAIHDLSVWLRNGSNPADINQFCSHIWKSLQFQIVFLLAKLIQWRKMKKSSIRVQPIVQVCTNLFKQE